MTVHLDCTVLFLFGVERGSISFFVSSDPFFSEELCPVAPVKNCTVQFLINYENGIIQVLFDS